MPEQQGLERVELKLSELGLELGLDKELERKTIRPGQ